MEKIHHITRKGSRKMTKKCLGAVFFILLSLFFIPSSVCHAQENMITVTGNVVDDATGKPMAGVIVTAYGDTRYSAMTDANGMY